MDGKEAAVQENRQAAAGQITITENAAARVQQLLEERELEGYALRLFVTGGGCSGYQYGMAFENEPRNDDLNIDAGSLNILVDPVSIAYLAGSRIDYVDDLMGGGFSIDNPNALTSCGCGKSFRASGEENPPPATGGCNC
jgi:iron-sulfur cluster assembly accessory protein